MKFRKELDVKVSPWGKSEHRVDIEKQRCRDSGKSKTKTECEGRMVGKGWGKEIRSDSGDQLRGEPTLVNSFPTKVPAPRGCLKKC